MPHSGANPGVAIRVKGGHTPPDLVPGALCESLDGGHGHALGPLTGEGEDCVPVAERGKRLTDDEQRILLDVDDPLRAGHPAVGRGADVDEQRQRELVASGAHVHVAGGPPSALRRAHRQPRRRIRQCRALGRLGCRPIRVRRGRSRSNLRADPPHEESRDAPARTSPTPDHRAAPLASRTIAPGRGTCPNGSPTPG